MEKPANPTSPDLKTSEDRAQIDLAPETHNAEQDDEPSQAQTLADEALGRRSAYEGADSDRVGDDDESGGTQDLVDHMKQMVSSGHIDMSAFRGERSDDDEDGILGEDGIEDEFPRGAE